MDDAKKLICAINREIINPLIILMFAVALFIFVWGIVEFIAQLDNDTARSAGKKHMLGGIIGMFIMVSAFGIIRLITNTFGLTAPGLSC